MNYQKLYDALIERASHRVLVGYSESHHVVPVCMGGGHEAANLVRLTPEEHFLAHKLLAKIHPDNWKVAFALLAMSRNNRGMRPTMRLFGWTRRRVATALSQSRIGKKHSESARLKSGANKKGRKLSEQHKAKISAGNKGKPKSAEHNAKVSAALKGRSDIGMYGKRHSEETKAKIRAKALARGTSPDEAERLKNYSANLTPEQRSAIARKAWDTKRRKQKIEAATQKV